MSKKRFKKIIPKENINWNNFSVFRINKDKSIVYRCNHCFTAMIKNNKKSIIRLSGHKPDCLILKKPYLYKNKNKNDSKNKYKNLNSNKLNQINKDLSKEKLLENISEHNTNLSELENSSNTIYTKNEIPAKINNEEFKYFSLLFTVFDKSNNLNKQQEDMNQYYINKKKILGKGVHSTTFLGEDKIFRFNVAILRMDIYEVQSFNTQTFILSRIHGKGNFPQLYNTYEDENYFYLVESLMGPTLKSLFNLCNKKFDIFTIINIAIDLIKNIQIFHNLGFVHRDLHPDNLVYGNLSYENYQRRNEIGIIDYGNAKINISLNGKIRYSKKKILFKGNRYFSSTRALCNLDIGKIDDIKNIMYILIYFFEGSLPWDKKSNKGDKLSKQEIIEIRKNIEIKTLCKNFPIEFINLTENIFANDENSEPDYNYIIKELEKIKLKIISKNKERKEKFIWIKLFKQYLEKPNEIQKEKKIEIESLFKRYNLNIKNYILYVDEEI